ncbi:MAG: Phosphoserine phosphatase [Candidatus Bathyarchaeota archaeon BA1]|nr:MAG: Phosphoserine phosphatase [Candidatus Bathyarchaeota archaeon BA1]
MKKLRLVVFDVDGTLIRVESSWQHLHEQLGTWDRGRKYAEWFFQGLITYEDWARLDASLWRGLSLERVQRIVNDIPYTDGARDVITTLRRRGLVVVLLSAGLSIVADRIRGEIGVDDSLANELVVKNGFLTGEVKVNVSFRNKDEVLRRFLERFSVTLDECAAVGDDETLIPLFKKVGLGIAFNPRKKVVEKRADVVVRGNDLRQVLPYLL